MKPLPEDWDRAVAVVAHPDDLEYGVASAIARWTGQGKTVTYLLATRGEAGIAGMHPDEVGPLRVEEERRSAAVVGVSERKQSLSKSVRRDAVSNEFLHRRLLAESVVSSRTAPQALTSSR